jgi:hypothetical protein
MVITAYFTGVGDFYLYLHKFDGFNWKSVTAGASTSISHSASTNETYRWQLSYNYYADNARTIPIWFFNNHDCNTLSPVMQSWSFEFSFQSNINEIFCSLQQSQTYVYAYFDKNRTDDGEVWEMDLEENDNYGYYNAIQNGGEKIDKDISLNNQYRLHLHRTKSSHGYSGSYHLNVYSSIDILNCVSGDPPSTSSPTYNDYSDSIEPTTSWIQPTRSRNNYPDPYHNDYPTPSPSLSPSTSFDPLWAIIPFAVIAGLLAIITAYRYRRFFARRMQRAPEIIGERNEEDRLIP